MGKLIFITGPVRSGKSRRAVELAKAWGEQVVFVATWRSAVDDAEMTERVRRHRAERPAWRTVEAPASMSAALAAMAPRPSGVVLDCLTLWLSDRMAGSDDAIVAAWSEELRHATEAPWPTIVIGNEVGWSLVPESAELRRFRDLAGTLAQRTAAVADEAWLMVAGCGVRLK
jgi:adenosylcobinamide kinase/adenosylcobinamide-phosphate guanylyltransferase